MVERTYVRVNVSNLFPKICTPFFINYAAGKPKLKPCLVILFLLRIIHKVHDLSKELLRKQKQIFVKQEKNLYYFSKGDAL